jgi:hypothetical protein
VGLDIKRIANPEAVRDLAPILVDLLNAGLPAAPHYRPVAVDELVRRTGNDPRFSERAILVACEDGAPVGWCHVEPPTVALTAGDLYPYVGAHTVFQPGLPHVASGEGYSAAVIGLLYAACQVRAQQGASGVELFAPADHPAENDLRAAGFQPVDPWATYAAALAGAEAGRAPVHVSSAKASELERFPAVLRDAGLLTGGFTTADLTALIESTGDFDPQGLLLAEAAGDVVGYAAVMIDGPYGAATGRRRAWLGFGPLGMGALAGPEQPERFATLVSAARISAFCRGATELALVARADGRQPAIWADRGFEAEVRWQRWRTEL